MAATRVGVLALQGGYAAHERVLRRLGAEVVQVRWPADLVGVDALVLPGGESTTIRKLAVERGLDHALVEAVAAGTPLLGTCAGAILAAREVEGYPGMGLGLIPVTVARNAYGTQRDSFVTESPPAAHGRVFIRAPRFVAWDDGVEVLDQLEGGGEVVALGFGRVLVATYHPELAGDGWLHERLLG